MGVCPACNGKGYVDGVWYGQKTGKKARCQLCGGSGKSDATRLI